MTCTCKTEPKITSAKVLHDGKWWDVTAFYQGSDRTWWGQDVYALPAQQGMTYACTCASDPYNCPQGQALVSAIIERKGNQ